MKDLSNKTHSMTHIIQSNLDIITKCKTANDIANLLNSMFLENNLDTPASRRLIKNVSAKHNYNEAITTVYNSLLCGSGLGVI